MRVARIPVLVVASLLALFLAACGQGEQSGEAPEGAADTPPAVAEEADTGAEPSSEEPAPVRPGMVVEVLAREYAFEGPSLVPSGWITFRLENEGAQTHFLLVYRFPEGKTQADLQEEVVPIYDRVMEALQAGEMDRAGALETLGSELPEWFFSVEFRGGPGLVAPGGSAQATVKLDKPGLYLMECYVKGPDGRFHSSMGMQKEFRVTEGAIEATPPGGDLTINLSNSGIEAPASVEAGVRTVRVNFKEDPPGGFPYDVHLARLTEDTDVTALKEWMDWMNVGGMKAPAPAEFIGGAENMAAGNHAFFTVDLEPGRYAWLSEVGATDNMYREFTVE